jgi:mitogen-activated protein kinase kinase kinase 13
MGNHPSPKLPEDPQERGAIQSELMEITGSPISTTVLTSVSEDSRGQFENSVLQLREQDESEMTLSLGNSNTVDGENTNGPEDIKIQFSRSGSGSGGFLEGLFGCLRPVWNIIGKAYSTDYKLQQQGKPEHVCPGKALLVAHSTSNWVIFKEWVNREAR